MSGAKGNGSRWWAGLLAITGLVACPCHLPLTLPLLLALLGGTGAAAFITTHLGLLYGLAAAYFIASLAGAWLLWEGHARFPPKKENLGPGSGHPSADRPGLRPARYAPKRGGRWPPACERRRASSGRG